MPPADFKLLSDIRFFPVPSKRWDPLAGKHGQGCWTGQFFPELCCQPPAGFAVCFLASTYTYEACCAEFLNRRPRRVEAPGLVVGGRGSAGLEEYPPLPKVDLVVRSWHEDMPMLRMLLLSLAVFWPFGALRTEVAVVLDGEAPESRAACAEIQRDFGNWARCIGEGLPPWERVTGGYKPIRPKAARVHWSTFLSDKYAKEADVVGILDADVVFHSYGAESLLFAPPAAGERGGQRRWRPVIFGRWSSTFAFSALAVQDEFPEASFMDALPMLVRREDFAAIREHMRQRWAAKLGVRSVSFDEAFALADRQVGVYAGVTGDWITGYHGEFLCFQAAMGVFLWRWRRQSYHYSVYGGLQRGLPLEASCPSLRVALHATELKRAAGRNASVGYAREARGLMAAGLCAAAAARGGLPARLAERCRAAPYQSEELLLLPDDVRLVGGTGHSPAALAASAGAWSALASGHCGERSVPRLLGAHWALLAGGGSRRQPARLLQWSLAANATGGYTYDPGAPPVSPGGAHRLEAMGVKPHSLDDWE